jgi:hypothetical protein
VLPHRLRRRLRIPEPARRACFTLILRSARAERRIDLFGHVGLLEAYFAGEIDIEGSLPLMFRAGLDMDMDMGGPPDGLPRLANAWHEFRFGNRSLERAKANARFHYGLGTDFYREWLDPDTLYVNFGFWDVVRRPRPFPPGHHNRLVEARVSALGASSHSIPIPTTNRTSSGASTMVRPTGH